MADAHETHEHLGHAEVAQTPREAGDDGDEPVFARSAEKRLPILDDLVAVRIENRVRDLRARQEAGNALKEGDGVVNAAGLRDAADEHGREREEHERALDEVGRAYREVPADERVEEHDDRSEHHHRRVVEPEERREQLAAGHKAASRVDGEEQKRDDRGDRHEDVLVVVKAIREEIGDRDRIVRDLGILAQALRDEFPVQIGADGKADRRPHGIRRPREIGNARQAHEQPARHVGSLGG